MRTRTLATVAIAAWSKTALAAPALLADTNAVAETPPNPSTLPPSCAGTPGGTLVQSGTDPAMIWTTTWAKGDSASCAPATLTLQASADGGHWKTLASAHTMGSTGNSFAYVQHSCLPGSWSYRTTYLTDDRSFKGTSATQQFKC